MTDRFPTPTPLRAATLTLALLLGGCTIYGDWFGGGDKTYKNNATRTQPLDVPPDLTQLTRDSRYLPQGGVVTASDLNKPGAPAAGATPAGADAAAGTGTPAAGPAQVALASAGDAHLEHEGDERFISTKESPDAAWPKVRQFWLEKGFTFTEENAQTGVLQTDWQVDKRSLPNGFIAKAINSVFSNLPDSGLRDRYRTRLERRPDGGTNIYVTHYGASEELTGFQKSETQWVPRPSDPQLEAEMMSQMMLALGGAPQAPANVAAATAPEGPASDALIAQAAKLPSAGTRDPNAPRVHIVPDQPGATLQVDDDFDHTWRRVGLALDHGGFTVEDRDRAQGLYFVRFVNAREAAKDEPGIISRIKGWFGRTPPSPVIKYRISIKSAGNVSTVTILNDQGQPDATENPQAMIQRLAEDLK